MNVRACSQRRGHRRGIFASQPCEAIATHWARRAYGEWVPVCGWHKKQRVFVELKPIAEGDPNAGA